MVPLEAVAWVAGSLGGVGAVALLVSANRRRYLSRFDFADWRERQYVAVLPNFLEALHDARLRRPWPLRLNGLSATWFTLRVRRVLRGRPLLLQRRFLRAHLNLCALIVLLRPYIEDAFLVEKIKIATGKLLEMGQSLDRDRLGGFIQRASSLHRAFEENLSPLDRRLQQEITRRHFICTLRKLHAVFCEHGYVLLAAFDDLRRWESLDPRELAQELPTLPDVPLRARHLPQVGA